jgi:pimeloyl-ACP methyl ester carboxylesterase
MPPLKVAREKIRPLIDPVEIYIARLANILPGLARAPVWYIKHLIKKYPEKAIRQLVKNAPACDLELLNDKRAMQHFQQTAAEACRGGTKGLVASLALEVKDWGFRLQDIRTHVTLWHGELDKFVYPSSAHYMAASLSDHTLHLIPGAGHLTLIARHAEAVLRSCAFPDRRNVKVRITDNAKIRKLHPRSRTPAAAFRRFKQAA